MNRQFPLKLSSQNDALLNNTIICSIITLICCRKNIKLHFLSSFENDILVNIYERQYMYAVRDNICKANVWIWYRD